MKFPLSVSTAVLCTLVGHVSSFPSMLDSLSPSARQVIEREYESSLLKKRQIQTLPPLTLPPINIPGLPLPLNIDLPGLVTVGRKIIPDADHLFKAPGPTDQRGGCPGLNLMANYGYIDRSGITNVGELLYAQQEMLGFDTVLAAFLVALSAKTMTDLTTLKMSIGLTDSRTSGPLTLLFGQAPGLFSPPAHNKYEVDGSLAYTDEFFTSDRSGNRFNSSIWAKNVAIAKANGGLMNNPFNAESRYAAYQRCVSTNPQCSWLFLEQLVFYAGETFSYLIMPSTGPDGNLEPATIDIVNTFTGAHDNGDGTYTKVPERLPAGSTGPWYRRSIPLTLAELVEAGLASLSKHPVNFGANSNGVNTFLLSGTQYSPSLTVNKVVCLLIDTLYHYSLKYYWCSVSRYSLNTRMEVTILKAVNYNQAPNHHK
ncbi:heme-thiolate peroxidase [Crepidotus variabilis]|uniref:Heme-thiolate peroxidase n=1 Tax=Crepidotus variabilis TaxID=179855 RepID=A0A9P6JQA6_9AGAR|nr:heme-thiolate peroxidase [Crepidotus variabilis]